MMVLKRVEFHTRGSVYAVYLVNKRFTNTTNVLGLVNSIALLLYIKAIQSGDKTG